MRLRQPTVIVGGHPVQVEIVSTPAAIRRGLMHRPYLAPNAGMLFLMGRQADHTFYMRNTWIPLDMIFIDHNLRVAGIVHNATPRTETLRHIGRPSLYVLEVNAGWAMRHHIGVGAPVRIEL